MTVLYLVRHGEVHNPEGIVYGRLPGFGLSAAGREQIEAAARVLAGRGPFDALFASPLQRAQESAVILSGRLGLPVRTDDLLVETGIGSYQGKPFRALPRPYITEEPTHEGLESASSIRARFLAWAEGAASSSGSVVAVSHRDPIAVALLHWQGRGLEDLPGFDLPTGGLYEVRLGVAGTRVEAVPAR